MTRAFATVTSVLVLCGLGACASRSDMPPLALQQPAAWQQGGAASPNQAVASAWWREMHDPLLTQLIDEALARNSDLAKATVRVRRAQLVAGQAASNLLPSVSVRGSSQASRFLQGDAGTQISQNVSASVAWEADLWGRLAAARQAADWEATATAQDRQATALALVGTTAQLYWSVAYLNQRVLASQQSIDYARKTLQLVEAQVRGGIASQVDLAQATQLLATQEAAHTQWLQQRVEARNALAILFDGPPGAPLGESQTLPESALPDVPAGVPASLLTRRPDLLASEFRLRGAVATVDATRRSFYPTLTLTGSVGGSSTALSKVLSDPVGTLGAGLVLPFVQWRDMERSVAISQADQETAVLSYRQTWYQALSEVENALSSRQQLEAQGFKLSQAVDAARQAERLIEVRYRAGTVALKTWLDAQEARRTAENNLAQNRLNRLSALVALYQALGGSPMV